MHFVDTNLVVYAYLKGDKAQRARELLNQATISVQVLNEFANVSIRKLKRGEDDLEDEVASILSQVAEVTNVDLLTHELARRIAFRYLLNFYDAALLAAALLAGCTIFYSEDMQDGLIIEGVLTIRNPFA